MRLFIVVKKIDVNRRKMVGVLDRCQTLERGAHSKKFGNHWSNPLFWPNQADDYKYYIYLFSVHIELYIFSNYFTKKTMITIKEQCTEPYAGNTAMTF